jgi:hypothetical protein
MPSHYAHYYFGNEVIRVMPNDVKNIISTNSECLDAYRMGLQGPDFLAFYRPGFPNALKKEGRQIHNAPGKLFFQRAIEILKENPTPESYSYIFGCINHFILDSLCHPIVTESMKLTELTHSKIEREFDNHILRICRKSPTRLKLRALFPHDEELDSIIARFYQSTTKKNTQEAVDTMTDVLRLFAAPKKSSRRRLYRLFTALPMESLNKTRDMIYFEKPEAKLTETNKKLFDALNKAVMTASTELDAFLNCLLLDKPLSETFEVNYLGISDAESDMASDETPDADK